MLNFFTKWLPLIGTIFAAIGGLSTLIVIIRFVFPDWYKHKVSPFLKKLVPTLTSIDNVVENILKTMPNNVAFKSIDVVVDYLLKELREAGYTNVTEQDVLQSLNDGKDRVKLIKSDDGWKIEYNKSF